VPGNVVRTTVPAKPGAPGVTAPGIGVGQPFKGLPNSSTPAASLSSVRCAMARASVSEAATSAGKEPLSICSEHPGSRSATPAAICRANSACDAVSTRAVLSRAVPWSHAFGTLHIMARPATSYRDAKPWSAPRSVTVPSASSVDCQPCTSVHVLVGLERRTVPHGCGMSSFQEGAGRRLSHQSESDDCHGCGGLVHGSIVNVDTGMKVERGSDADR